MGCSSFDNVITNPMSATAQTSPDHDAKTRIHTLSAFSDNYIWLVSNGETAVVVDPGDAAPVLDALRRLADTTPESDDAKFAEVSAIRAANRLHHALGTALSACL